MAGSIRKNFLLNCILTATSILFPMITFPYVSRILLPGGMGKVALAISVVAYFDLFAQLGIPTYGVRACARVRGDRTQLTRTAHELLVINLVTTLISYVALFIAIATVPKLREEKLLYLVVSSTMFLSAAGMEWLYKAMEQYSYITLRSVFFKILSLISMFLLIHEQSDYVLYGFTCILANSASNLCNFFCIRKLIGTKPVGGYCFRRHLKPVFTFFAFACATTVYTNLDSVMLGFLRSDDEVGIYNSAVKIKSVLVSVVTSLGVVILPRASNYIEQGKREEFWRISKKSLNFVLLMSLPLCLYFMLYSRTSIYLLSGGAFENSILPMRLIMPTLVFIGITNVLGIQILVPLLKEKIVLYSTVAGALTNLVFNLTLIPKFGVVGAAIGTVVAEFAVLIVQLLAIRTIKPDLFSDIRFFKIALALLSAVIAAVWTLFVGWSNIVTLFVSALLFFGVYAIVLLLTKEPFVISLILPIKASLARWLKK